MMRKRSRQDCICSPRSNSTTRDDPCIRHYLPLFRKAAAGSGHADWDEWRELLASHDHPSGEGRAASMCFRLQTGLSTLSSSLIALPCTPASTAVRYGSSPGPPDRAGIRAVDLELREYQHLDARNQAAGAQLPRRQTGSPVLVRVELPGAGRASAWRCLGAAVQANRRCSI